MLELTRRELIGGGAVIATQAFLVRANAQAGLRTRRDVNQLALNDPTLVSYQRAVAEMVRLDTDEPGNPRSWTNQARIHQNLCPHGNWFFLPWHRAYLNHFEDICRKLSGDESFALPYWNWTLNPQIPSALWESGSPLNHARDADQNSSVEDEFVGVDVLNRIMRKADFEGLGSRRASAPRGGSGGGSGTLESSPHNRVHVFTGGDMASFMSPLDPVFWLHHCNVDRIWASWNDIGNINPSDPAFADFVLDDNFVDRDGQAVDVKISAVYDTQGLGYTYDRLEPRPVANTATVPPGAVLTPIADFREPLSGTADPGVPLSANVAVETDLLARFSGTLQMMTTEGGPGAPQEAGSINLKVSGIRPPEDARAFVRLFVNCDYLTSSTPINDPHYVGSFSFFLDKHGTDGDMHTGVGNYVFDLTSTLDALRRSGNYPGSGIEPQLLAFNGRGEPTELSVDGALEVTFLQAKV